MNPNGHLTSAAARFIAIEMDNQGYDVYYDHGQAAEFVGKIAVSIDEELHKKNEISQLDIAVVERATNKAIALVEIEETTDNPKTLIGDLFAVLMGNAVYCPGRKKVNVGDWTTLIVIGKGSTGHKERKAHILKLAKSAGAAMGTNNSRVGELVIETISEDADLEELLMEQINAAYLSEYLKK